MLSRVRIPLTVLLHRLSEQTPCISITAPEEEDEEEEEMRIEGEAGKGRASMDSGYQTPLSRGLPLVSAHHLDVCL